MMEEAVGERPTELLVKEDEQQRDLGSFLCQAISVTLPVSGEQSVRFEFAQIVSELVESIAVRTHAEGGQYSFMDLAGGPAGGPPRQNFLADHRLADHVLKEIRHLPWTGQSAQITVDHHTVKTVVYKEQQAAKQPCECLHRSPSRVLV